MPVLKAAGGRDDGERNQPMGVENLDHPRAMEWAPVGRFRLEFPVRTRTAGRADGGAHALNPLAVFSNRSFWS
jgi:hypothetical protein